MLAAVFEISWAGISVFLTVGSIIITLLGILLAKIIEHVADTKKHIGSDPIVTKATCEIMHKNTVDVVNSEIANRKTEADQIRQYVSDVEKRANERFNELRAQMQAGFLEMKQTILMVHQGPNHKA